MFCLPGGLIPVLFGSWSLREAGGVREFHVLAIPTTFGKNTVNNCWWTLTVETGPGGSRVSVGAEWWQLVSHNQVRRCFPPTQEVLKYKIIQGNTRNTSLPRPYSKTPLGFGVEEVKWTKSCAKHWRKVKWLHVLWKVKWFFKMSINSYECHPFAFVLYSLWKSLPTCSYVCMNKNTKC